MKRGNWTSATVPMILGALVSGCGPTVSSSVFTPAPPKATDHPVAVFMTKTPSCPYEEIGVVSVSEGAFSGGVDTYLPALKDRARKMGGDALLGYRLGSRASGATAVAPGVVGLANEEMHSATVVRFTDPACRESPSE